MTSAILATPPRSAGAGPRLALFDGFALEQDGAPLELPVTLQRLIAYLAVRGPVSRSVVAGTLWPDSTEERALASLRTAMWRLRRGLGDLVELRRARVALTPRVWVDAQAFGLLARQVLHHDQPLRPEELDDVADWRADLLPGWDDDWVFFQRERYRQQRMHLLEALSAQLLARHRFAEALDAALDAVQIEPLRESGHCAVMAVHLAEGNYVEARREYERFCVMARAELGVGPSPRMRALMMRTPRVPAARTGRDLPPPVPAAVQSPSTPQSFGPGSSRQASRSSMLRS